MSNKKERKNDEVISFSAPEKSQLADLQGRSASVVSVSSDTLLDQLRDWVMMRQNMRIMNIDYRPARLVRTTKRWYFQFYQTNPVTGKLERHRLSFSIGHYPAEYREAKAHEVLAELNQKLPFGYPYDPVQVAAARPLTIRLGLDLAMKYCADLRPDTLVSYRSWIRKFIKFLETIGMADQPVTIVNKKIALAYSDHLTEKGISARSHNNDINGISTIWGMLLKRELVDRNPFSTVPRRKKKASSRRPVPPYDAEIILNYLQETDVSVYVSCLLLFYCLIRPNEQRQLQRYHFHLERSVIQIPAHISKNGEEHYITIPDELKERLINCRFLYIPPGQYVIGSADSLGKTRPTSRSRINTRYKKAITILYNEQLISSIEGHSIYSWKNTGMDALTNARTPGRSYQNQARHHSLEESERYMSRMLSSDPFIRENHRLKNILGGDPIA